MNASRIIEPFINGVESSVKLTANDSLRTKTEDISKIGIRKLES